MIMKISLGKYLRNKMLTGPMDAVRFCGVEKPVSIRQDLTAFHSP